MNYFEVFRTVRMNSFGIIPVELCTDRKSRIFMWIFEVFEGKCTEISQQLIQELVLESRKVEASCQRKRIIVKISTQNNRHLMRDETGFEYTGNRQVV